MSLDNYGNSPRDYVRALVCHYPHRLRQTRLLLMLRAYIDDSKHLREAGIAGGVYVLSGYVGDATRWEAFTDAWDNALHCGPRSLVFLKTVDAYRLTDPKSMFYGWTSQERDDKLLLLAKTINRHALVSIQTAARPEQYKSVIGDLTGTRVYHFLFYSLIAELVKMLGKWQLKDKIDIYFDRQIDEYEDQLRAGFREFMADAPQELKDRIGGGGLEFKSDHDITPLQAADLIAWHFRRNIFEHDRGRELAGPVWTELLNLPRLTGVWNRHKLTRWLDRRIVDRITGELWRIIK